MKNVLLHIGFHKTGTTWLQNELFCSSNSTFFSLSKIPNGPSTLATKFIYSKEGYLLNSFNDNKDFIKEELQEYQCPEDKIPVVSHERLSGNPHSSGFDAKLIADRLKDSFQEAKVLIVIREQSSWVLSNYFQYLSIGGDKTIKDYLTTKYDGKRPGFSFHHIEYHHLIKYYQTLFGKNNVLVLPYELLVHQPYGFINSIEQFLNIEIDKSQLNFQTKYNSRQKHFISYRFRKLNSFIVNTSVSNSYVKNIFFRYLLKKSMSTLKFLDFKALSKKIKTQILNDIEQVLGDKYKSSNQITQTLIDFELKKNGYKI